MPEFQFELRDPSIEEKPVSRFELRDPVLGKATEPQERFELKDPVLEAEEVLRPGIGEVLRRAFAPTIDAAKFALQLGASGIESLKSVLSGRGPIQLPPIPQAVPQPFRAIGEAARTVGEVGLGLGEALVDPLITFGSPLAQLGVPFREAGKRKSIPEALAGPFAEFLPEVLRGETARRISGATVGGAVEVLTGVGAGTAALRTGKEALRIPGLLLGGIPEARPPAFRVPPGVDPKVPKDSATMKELGEAFIPNYKQGEEYVSLVREREGARMMKNREAKGAFKDLNKLSKQIEVEKGIDADDAAVVVADALRGQGDEKLIKAVKPARDTIDKLSREFPELGLLPEQVIEENLGIYLRRKYLTKMGIPFEPEPEVVGRATTYLKENLRIPVSADDPSRSAKSLLLEETVTGLRSAFRRQLRETPKKGEVRFSERVVNDFKKDLLGTVKTDVEDLINLVETRPTFKQVFINEFKRSGFTEGEASQSIKAMRDEIREINKFRAEQRLEHPIELMGERLRPILERFVKHVRLQEGRKIEPERAGEAIALGKKIVSDVRDHFVSLEERLKATKHDALTLTEIRTMEKEFRNEIEAIRGKGPLRFRDPSDAEVESFIEQIVEGQEFPAFIGRRNPARINMGPTMRRKDIAEPIRELMGEVKGGPLMAALTIRDIGDSVINAKFLESFAKGSEQIGDRVVPWISDTALPGYRKMPDSPAWGAVRNKYVLDRYHDDLTDFVGSFTGAKSGLPEYVSKPYNFLLNTFKISKTVFNPATWVRNVFGDTFFADLAQIPVWDPRNAQYYARAAWELTQSGEGLIAKGIRAKTGAVDLSKTTPFVREAIESGAIGTEFATSELRLVGEAFVQKDPLQAMLAVGKKPIAAQGRFYNAQDAVFKMASFIKQRELGMEAREAANHVNTWFPNYREVPAITKVIRAVPAGGAFASFSSEMVRITANAAKEHPVKLAKWMLMPHALAAASASAIGMTTEEFRDTVRGLPERLQTAFLTLLPFRDEKENPQVIDLTYALPHGSIFGTSRLGGLLQNVPFIGQFILNEPVVNTAAQVLNNVKFINGRPVIRLGKDAMKEIATFTAREFLPPLTPRIPGVTTEGGYAFEEIYKAYLRSRGEPALGRFGQVPSLGKTVLSEVGAFRAIPVDPALRGFAVKEKAREMEELRKSLMGAPFEMFRGQSPQEVQETIKRLIEQLQEVPKR